jgi:hypothetical protein
MSDLTILISDRFLVLSPLSVLAAAALVAPRLQLFTYLMCKDLDTGQWDPKNGGTGPDTLSMGPTRPISCAADPVVQANVAMFLMSLCHSIQQFISASYEIRISHRDGARHLELLDSDLLGICACSYHSPYFHPEIFKFTDRYGRVKFLGLGIFTLLLGDAALAALAVTPEYVPGGYWFLLFTSALGGLVGGGFRDFRPQNSATSYNT